MNKATNNNAVDLMKFLCAILVVAIHSPPLLSINENANFILVEIIARIAVPFFFVCSGYFVFKKINFSKGKIDNNLNNFKTFQKTILNLISIYFFWTIFYLIWWIPLWYKGNNLTLANLKGYVLSIFTLGSYYHLWYLVALIYGMLFTYLLLSFLQVKLVIPIAIIFYLIGTIEYSYVWIFSGIDFFEQFFKLYELLGSISIGVFRAFPYLVMGFVFSKYRVKINIPLSGILGLIFFISLGMEVWLLKNLGYSSKYSYVLLTGLTVFFIFNTVSKVKLPNNTCYPILRKMSSIIYFIHPMFININGIVISYFLSNNNSVLLFSSVLFYVLIFSIGFIKLSKVKLFNKVKTMY